jgi:hypothetical protein
MKRFAILLPLLFCGCIWLNMSVEPVTNSYGMLIGKKVTISYYEANEETILTGLVNLADKIKKVPALPVPTVPTVPPMPPTEPEEPVEPEEPIDEPDDGEGDDADTNGSDGESEPSTIVDEVDLSTVQWMDGNLSDWKIVTPLEVTHQGIVLNYQHNANWGNHPELERRVGGGGQIAGNFHIGRWNGHKWQVCGWEWFRPGQHHCQKNIFTKEGHACHGMAVTPIQPGEDVLFMVSTGARVGLHSVDTRHQRSQLIKRKWK